MCSKTCVVCKRYVPCSVGISSYVDMVDIVKLNISRVRLESVDL
jgi:hypothetical protein